mgnify:CR=1 FL=1|tara:strand:- start:18261 stop:18617 length:357 start_codon:yes stop_codon:yes gene_type:complete
MESLIPLPLGRAQDTFETLTFEPPEAFVEEQEEVDVEDCVEDCVANADVIDNVVVVVDVQEDDVKTSVPLWTWTSPEELMRLTVRELRQIAAQFNIALPKYGPKKKLVATLFGSNPNK